MGRNELHLLDEAVLDVAPDVRERHEEERHQGEAGANRDEPLLGYVVEVGLSLNMRDVVLQNRYVQIHQVAQPQCELRREQQESAEHQPFERAHGCGGRNDRKTL